MAAVPTTETREAESVQHAAGRGRSLAAGMPRLMLEARRVAATVIHGLHGRRRAGSGENFWQYRRFISGEPAARVDWRRSARDDHLYVREREWEAAHTVWIWPDRSPSMVFSSPPLRETKMDRTLIVAEIQVHPGALARGVDLQDLFGFWERTNAEDRAICELQQRGLGARRGSPGCYATSEDGLHAFERIVAARYLGALFGAP